MIPESTLRQALSKTLDRTDFTGLGAKYEGKVRDNYSTADGRRFIVVTDRISAFDHVLGTIPFKGQVLNALAAHWFERTKHVVLNHMIGMPDPNVLECVECTPLLVEMVMRSYLTGTTSTSIWTHYEAGSRLFCGHSLPDGMRKNQKLSKPILTPATKAPKGEHDISGSREEILATGNVTAVDFDAAAALAEKLFAAGQAMCAERGLILDIRRPRCGDPLPETLEEHAGVGIFGGPMSANDHDDYVRQEIEWTEVPLREQKPFFGICLGAQILARALGAKVDFHPQGLVEVGYYPLRATEAGKKLLEWPDHVYQWHREGFDLPADAVLLAEGDAFQNQAFQYGRAAFAFGV